MTHQTGNWIFLRYNAHDTKEYELEDKNNISLGIFFLMIQTCGFIVSRKKIISKVFLKEITLEHKTGSQNCLAICTILIYIWGKIVELT